MRVWLITVGEPLPLDEIKGRLYRTGILSEIMQKRGHKVIWWTSTVDHIRKKLRFKTDKSVNLPTSNLRIIYLHSILYRKNISFRRIINHVGIARKFRVRTEQEKKPDIILCSFPTIELCVEAVRYALANHVPIIIDVRDLWPDIFLDLIPRYANVVLRLFLWRWFNHTRFLFQHCTAITGVSRGYRDWGLNYAGREQSDYDYVFPLGYIGNHSAICDRNGIAEEMANIGVNPSNVIFLFIGSFGTTYDLSTVIKAACCLESEQVHRVQFILCGDGDLNDKWNAQADGLGNVVFTGWMNIDQINYLLSIADVGLAAYRKDAPQGLPNKLFEYMSAGLPILSSLKGEVEQLIEKAQCGYSYRACDVGDFLKGVQMLLDDSHRQKMGRNSLKTFMASYQAEKVYGRLSEYLEKVYNDYLKGKLQ